MSVTPDPAVRSPIAPGPAARADGSGSGLPALVSLADRCVQCGLCLPHCPTYRLDRSESESPRGRIAWARAVATGRLEPSPAGDRHLDHCLGCRRCEPVCPAGVEYGELLLQARSAQAARRPLPAPARRILALLARPGWLDRLLGLYRGLHPWLPGRWRLLPRPPARRPRDPGAGTAAEDPAGSEPAIFVGCIARRYEGPTRAALTALLRACGADPVLPAGQGCCGAAAAHAGLATDAAGLAAGNRAAFAERETVLCLASGCHATLAGSLAATTRVEEPLEWLDRHGHRLAFRPARRRVALHVPCTQRSVVGSDGALRRLLARVPELDLVLLPDTGCCGAAGLHQILEPARAAALRAPLLAALEGSGAAELLSANVGCRLHLGNGTTLPVRHPIDFLAEHLA